MGITIITIAVLAFLCCLSIIDSERFEKYVTIIWKAVGQPYANHKLIITDRKLVKIYMWTILALNGANPIAKLCFGSEMVVNGKNIKMLFGLEYGDFDMAVIVADICLTLVLLVFLILQFLKEFHDSKKKKKSLVVMYAANIANDIPILSYEMAKDALPDDYEPVDGSPVRIQIDNDRKDSCFWDLECNALNKAINAKVLPFMQATCLQHFSIFAIAPMPLLVKLGTLLNEKYSVEVFQKHRNPDNWKRLEEATPDYIIKRPSDNSKQPVLALSLSDTIIDRIKALYGSDASIWEVTVNHPNMDMMRTKEQQVKFCRIMRDLLSEMSKSPSFDCINVHMAIPVVCAVELGRVWMPKAHNALKLYDYQNGTESETITIKNE